MTVTCDLFIQNFGCSLIMGVKLMGTDISDSKDVSVRLIMRQYDWPSIKYDILRYNTLSMINFPPWKTASAVRNCSSSGRAGVIA